MQLILNAKDGVGGFDAKEGERIQSEVMRQRLCVPEELAVFTQRMQGFWSPPLHLSGSLVSIYCMVSTVLFGCLNDE